MSSEEIEALSFPAPIFHDLRRQLHKIPSHVDPIKRLDFHFAQKVMQQVAKFVETKYKIKKKLFLENEKIINWKM